MWQMTCPQCGAAMGTVEKAGAHIEQCPACQGVFLDRSQLDRVLAAEARFYSGPLRREAVRRHVTVPHPRRSGAKGSFVAELFD
jgi:Zn-finger nucleic acid-binding protein